MSNLEQQKTIESLAATKQKEIESSLAGHKNQAADYNQKFQADFQAIENAMESKGRTQRTCKTLDNILHQSVIKAVGRMSAITGMTENEIYAAMRK